MTVTTACKRIIGASSQRAQLRRLKATASRTASIATTSASMARLPRNTTPVAPSIAGASPSGSLPAITPFRRSKCESRARKLMTTTAIPATKLAAHNDLDSNAGPGGRTTASTGGDGERETPELDGGVDVRGPPMGDAVEEDCRDPSACWAMFPTSVRRCHGYRVRRVWHRRTCTLALCCLGCPPRHQHL